MTGGQEVHERKEKVNGQKSEGGSRKARLRLKKG